VRDAVRAGAQLLASAGVAASRREAAHIWEAFAGAPYGAAWRRGTDFADPARLAQFQSAIRRRVRGEPLAHVLGSWGFRHLELEVTPDVLIPRPETEQLVDLLLAHVRTGRVADLGTGSACIALALASEGNFSHVVATDLSDDALAVARRNAEHCGLCLTLVRGDFGGMLAKDAFDAVVSNPPYLTEAEYAVLDASVKSYEPRLALESGADGLRATRTVLQHARRALRPGGWLALEIDATRGAETARLAHDAGLAGVTLHKDLFGRERFLLAQRSK
jgi:release factor glutamine methyltransferase